LDNSLLVRFVGLVISLLSSVWKISLICRFAGPFFGWLVHYFSFANLPQEVALTERWDAGAWVLLQQLALTERWDARAWVTLQQLALTERWDAGAPVTLQQLALTERWDAGAPVPLQQLALTERWEAKAWVSDVWERPQLLQGAVHLSGEKILAQASTQPSYQLIVLWKEWSLYANLINWASNQTGVRQKNLGLEQEVHKWSVSLSFWQIQRENSRMFTCICWLESHCCWFAQAKSCKKCFCHITYLLSSKEKLVQ